MPSAVVVEALDIAVDAGLSLLMGEVLVLIDRLSLQVSRAALQYSMVVAVAPATHALHQVIFIEHIPVIVPGILAALV